MNTQTHTPPPLRVRTIQGLLMRAGFLATGANSIDTWFGVALVNAGGVLVSPADAVAAVVSYCGSKDLWLLRGDDYALKLTTALTDAGYKIEQLTATSWKITR